MESSMRHFNPDAQPSSFSHSRSGIVQAPHVADGGWSTHKYCGWQSSRARQVVPGTSGRASTPGHAGLAPPAPPPPLVPPLDAPPPLVPPLDAPPPPTPAPPCSPARPLEPQPSDAITPKPSSSRT